MKRTLLSSLLLFLLPTTIANSPHSADPTFTLHNITYNITEIYRSPSFFAIHDATVSYHLTNSALSYTTQCSAHSSHIYGYFYGGFFNDFFPCDPPPSGVGAGAVANFTFNAADYSFGVNQTWNLDGVNYIGMGSGLSHLDCRHEYWTNDHWTEGQDYSTNLWWCVSHVDVEITVTVSRVEV
ncbi:hypothetical protein BU16DRAFT_194203 [Lophium mytilinum]|uniref:AA1-like domain-containing protein n=1 Tax=Lophium mytilinum TaxID=390894 RepID=A0A6A6R8V2_9PEZI|nr:hypothetical protein BU16DRAFT_194203 [Lophium mytilinum]